MTNLRSATPIIHGRLPYLCSKKISKHTFCTAKADVVLTTGSKAVLCSDHYKAL